MQVYFFLSGTFDWLTTQIPADHTTKDTVDRLQPGSLTNMGENLLALLRHLCSDSSPPLTAIEPIRSTVYFSILGRIFISYPADKGTLFYATHLIVFVSYLLRFEKRSQWRSRMYALAGVPLSFLAAILSTNFVALLMTLAKKTLSWYRYEFFSVVLFGPPAVFGMLTTQYFVLKIARARGMAGFNMENATLSAVGLFLAIVALVGHVLGAHSSYILALSSFSLTFSLFINDGLTAKSPWDVALSTYLLASFPTTIVGAESFMGFLEIFVPLGGRSGHDAPFDFIIASAIGGITFLSAPWVLPYAHRHGLAGLRRLVFAFGAISLALVVIFMNVSPFDADHPKRLFALHMTNLSTTPPTFALHVAGMDGGPAFEPLVMQTADAVGLDSSKLERNVISDSIPDWDIIYPISQFLLSYKVPLPPPSADFKMPVADTFKVTLEKSSLNPVKKQRSLQLKVDHPGIIWSVIAFTGDVVEWSLPEPPERGALRHHVKEASRYSRNHWTLDLTLQLTESEFEAAQRMSQRAKGQRSTKDLVEVEADRTLGGLRIDFSGLDEKGIWEAKRETYIAGTIPGMEFFRGMKSVLGDEIDSMMLTAVAGVAYL